MHFNQSYNRDIFNNFLENKLLPEDYETEFKKVSYSKNFKYTQSVTRLGKSKELDLLVYEVKHSSVNDARVGLSKEAFRMMADEFEGRALIAFVPEDNPANYRLSLVTVDLSLEKDKVKREYSNPRRYSYFLGEGIGTHTPDKYLAKGRIKNAEDLRERFSVEVLTKEFYAELSDWYAWAVSSVHFPGEPLDKSKLNEHRSKNVIRLLTRLLFVWFLKQKNLIPKEFFDEGYIAKNLLKKFSPNEQTGLFDHKEIESKYYKAILQNLFFATLNCPIESADKKTKRGFRSKDQHFDINNLMRYEKYFKNPELFLKLANDSVPFLNGGLFDCLDDKANKNYIDGFSDNLPKPNKLSVPDFLFFGERQNVDLSEYYGDKKKTSIRVSGLIDILKKYNFTVEENTPSDQEISLDPELLGKVFENLLASYNPETRTSARKQTGSFYTPREIVQYMVDESLIAHLKEAVDTELEDEYRKLTKFTDEPLKLKDAQKESIIEGLFNCKILDPACGSGAFPMGVLQQMVHILTRLDPENKSWRKILENEATQATKHAYTIDSAEERNARLDEIRKNFDDSTNTPDYARKLYLIEKCIFGVDIQSIAVQISKLRFFISLIVEQIPTTNAFDNFGIRPLPNLEAKFVAANTLVGLQKKIQGNLFDTDAIKEKKELLINAVHKIFGARTSKTKTKYKEQVKTLNAEMAAMLEAQGSIGNDEARKLAAWDMFDQNASASFFDAEWMFGLSKEKGGLNCGYFDLCIGNPPYIKEYTDKSVFDNVRSSPYYQGKMDLWYLFACNGIDLLANKGLLCFIATNNWTTSSGASKLRNKVIEDSRIISLLDFGNLMIFESASIQTMVMLFQKNKFDDNYEFDFRGLNGKTNLSDAQHLMQKNEKSNTFYVSAKIKRESFKDRFLTFSDDKNESVLMKISNAHHFKLDDKDISQGIVIPQDFLNRKNNEKLGNRFSVNDPIFVLTQSKLDELELGREKSIIKPYYESDSFNNYTSIEKNRLWIIYTGSEFKNVKKISPFPKIRKHLDHFAKIITSDNKPYGLHRAREERIFLGEKIIAKRKCVERPEFSYVNFDSYVSATFNIIKTHKANHKYLTGLLNSKPVAFWLRQKGKMQGNNYQLDKEPLMNIPIYQPTPEQSKQIENLVDKIIALRSNGLDSVKFEKQIDELFYEFYNLTEDEIKIILSTV